MMSDQERLAVDHNRLKCYALDAFHRLHRELTAAYEALDHKPALARGQGSRVAGCSKMALRKSGEDGSAG